MSHGFRRNRTGWGLGVGVAGVRRSCSRSLGSLRWLSWFWGYRLFSHGSSLCGWSGSRFRQDLGRNLSDRSAGSSGIGVGFRGRSSSRLHHHVVVALRGIRRGRNSRVSVTEMKSATLGLRRDSSFVDREKHSTSIGIAEISPVPLMETYVRTQCQELVHPASSGRSGTT
jgi:hypothetical protein